MENKERKQKLIQLILEGIIIILGVSAFLTTLIHNIHNFSSSSMAVTFRYFTNDGNLFSLLCVMVSFVINLIHYIKKKDYSSEVMYLFMLSSAVSEAIIFLVVLLMLMPFAGVKIILGYYYFIYHVLNPLLIIADFLLFYKKSVSVKKCAFGFIPVLLYALISTSLCLLRIWEGDEIPYPFLKVYENPWYMSVLYAFLIVGGAFMLSIALNFLNKRLKKD